MKKTAIVNVFVAGCTKARFQLIKHSPEIFVVAGVIGIVTSAVMACKATTRVSEILEKTKNDLDSINNCAGNESLSEKYSPEDAMKDTAIVYFQAGVKLVKLYAPAISLGVLSIAGVLTSNNILRKRNVALAAAYATVDKGFKEYRNRVIDRFGREIDRELKYNIKAKKIEEFVADENGNEKKVKKTIEVAEAPSEYSDYARFFDDGCAGWEKNSGYNLSFLKAQQQYANDKLRANGYLYLNDVYDMLGIPRSKAGQIVGWVYNPENPNGDNYVDFGIYNVYKEKARDFVNGYEEAILLDFNVDGNIWELM
jgi:hypothetical protein